MESEYETDEYEYSTANDESSTEDESDGYVSEGYDVIVPMEKYSRQFEIDVELVSQEPNIVITLCDSISQIISFNYSMQLVPENYLSVLGLVKNDIINITIDFKSTYMQPNISPKIVIQNAKKLEWQLTNSIRIFIEKEYIHFIDLFDRHEYRSGSGFIINLYKHLILRINNAGNYCVNCDEILKCPGLKPVSCQKKLCYYQYTELGIS